ncbi:hypothetical protein PSP6_690135 [Paraburkholderia tropica]|uniref:hypothetical protein n=1 Tax=Paraburkholderia tropica TaxID=92647 RepID=UPI001CAD6C84|nr:hypothetical protein [Paraburkholderia tropica]CAG9236060.1 hypothetical protein PSP6_690135 [Paraburkholderia tropica]
MREREIFLVMANTGYEGSDPVRSFAAREDADAFAAKCNAYDASYKRAPDMDASDAEWEQWQKEDRSWELEHPAQPFIRRFNYDVMPLRFTSRR